MFSVTITEKGGEAIVQEFDKDEITIGRIQGNDIVLPKSNISKRHAHIVVKDGGFEVVDCKSTNGTYINGKRIDAPHELHLGDRIFVGDYTLELRSGSQVVTPPPAPEHEGAGHEDSEKDVLSDETWGAADAGPKEQWADDWGKDDQGGEGAAASTEEPAAGGVATAGRAPYPANPQAEPAARRAPRPAAPAPKPEPEAPQAARPVAKAVPAGSDFAALGPLAPLMQDDMVAQVLVNGPGHVYVERAGKLVAAECALATTEELSQLITRLITAGGGHIDSQQPFAEVRLVDGSRVTAAIAPLALRGPVLTVRKGMREPLMVDDLVAFSTLSPEMAGVLETCIKARVNVILCGSPGAGLTTTLNVFASYVPAEDRIVTVEESAELKLEQPDVVGLVGRSSTGAPVASMAELLRAGLRLRPDRLVIDECMGSTSELLQAFASGYDGKTRSCASRPSRSPAHASCNRTRCGRNSLSASAWWCTRSAWRTAHAA